MRFFCVAVVLAICAASAEAAHAKSDTKSLKPAVESLTGKIKLLTGKIQTKLKAKPPTQATKATHTVHKKLKAPSTLSSLSADFAKNREFLEKHDKSVNKLSSRKSHEAPKKESAAEALESQSKQNKRFLDAKEKKLGHTAHGGAHFDVQKAVRTFLASKERAQRRFTDRVNSFDGRFVHHKKASLSSTLSKQRAHNTRFVSAHHSRPEQLSRNAKHVLHAIRHKATRSQLSLLPHKPGHSQSDELAEAKRIRHAANNDLLVSDTDESFRALHGFN